MRTQAHTDEQDHPAVAPDRPPPPPPGAPDAGSGPVRRTTARPRASLRVAFSVVLAWIVTPHAVLAAPWVVITEIHYHPPESDALEFIEILNREPPRLDLSDWSVDGEIEFVFPPDVTLLPGEYLVVARDPHALRERYPALRNVLGPFRGKLDDDGGRITLRNPAGGVACEARYGRDGEWPTPPDGAGHTLSIESPYFDPADPASWRSSSFVGGTPGAPNEGKLIVKKGDEWRYRRGQGPAPADWNRLEYDDSGWESGPSGFGYSDGDDATLFPDMEDNYASVFVRRRFDVPDPSTLRTLVLRVDFDDGFVAYLNGREVARANLGQPGRPVRFDEFAGGSHEAGTPEEFSLGAARELLRSGILRRGANLLAVQVHNREISSSDLTLIVELESRAREAALGEDAPRINEVALGTGDASPGEAGFVEIFNPGSSELDLDGLYLSDDPAALTRFKLPPTIVEPRGFASVSLSDLDARFASTGGELFITLATPDGRRVLDALRLDLPAAAAGASTPLVALGRYPDGSSDISVLSRPSPGQANAVDAIRDIVINEIMYHPITGSTDDEFIEIYNRGARAIPLGGFSLHDGVRYTFADGDVLEPGAYLVIAKNPEALRSRYALPEARVRGPYAGQLSDRGETLTLVDRRGGVVDRVRYADRAPWSHWADGLGSSLELRNPALDNTLAQSWEASDERAKAEWQTLRYTKPHRYVMDGLSQEFQMMLLADGECFIDDVSLGGSRTLIQNGDFSDRGRWVAMGTHELSHVVPAGSSGGGGYFHLISDGRGNPRQNYVASPVRGSLRRGASYEVSLRAKWQRGSPLLLTRLAGQSLAQLHRLQVPVKLGSPGERNSVYDDSAAPALGVPEQRPIAPAANEEVTLSVAISALTEVESAAVHVRHEDDDAWRRVPLSPQPPAPPEGELGRARVWQGRIPALPRGQVEFYVEARDREGRRATYPPGALDAGGAPVGSALYAVGILPHAGLPTYTLLVSDREWSALRSRPMLSNRMASGTLVFGSDRIFYGVRFRPRGSPFTRRGRDNWRIVFGDATLDGRRSLTIDAQPNGRLGERLTFWLIDALHAPNSRHQFVSFRIHGRGESGTFEDIEKVDGAFLDRWFSEALAPPGASAGSSSPDASPGSSTTPGRGLLHKVDDYWELTARNDRQYEEAFFQYRSRDPEDYRWNFPPRAEDVRENFDPLIGLVQFLDARRTSDADFFEKAGEVIAVDEWIRVLAVRMLSGDWDTIGGSRGKNAFVYLSPVDNLWYLLPWDADLSWNRHYHQLSSRKFWSIARLLESPLGGRLFHGYLEYLVRRKLDPGYFDQILEDLRARSGKSVDRYAQYASQHIDLVLRTVERSSGSVMRITGAERIPRPGEPDLARITGIAPPLVRRFLLDGIEGNVELSGRERFTAEFPIGPEDGDRELRALDFGGYAIESIPPARVRIAPRPGAIALSEGGTASEKNREDVAVVTSLAGADQAGVDTATAGQQSAEVRPAVRRREPRRFSASESRRGSTVVRTPSLSRRQTARRRTVTPDGRSWPRRERAAGRRGRGSLGPALVIGAAVALVILQLVARSRRRRTLHARTSSGGATGSWRFDGATTGNAPPPVAPRATGPPRDDPVPVPTVARPQEPPAPDGGRVRTSRDRMASPVGAALRELGGRDFDRASEALQFLWTAGREDFPALIGAVQDRRSTPFAEIEIADDGGLRALPAHGEPGVEIRDVAEFLLASALGEPPADRPTQEDWVAHWRKTMG